MIEQTTTVTCNGCLHTEIFAGLIKTGDVEERLLSTGWTIEDEMHYCASCSIED